MKPSYSLCRLSRDAAAPAYPLVRDVAGAGSLQAWLDFVAARQTTGDESGVLAVKRGGYIRGVFAWRLVRDLADKPVLAVDFFVVSDTLLRQSATLALLDGLDALARRLGAHAIAADLEPGSEAMDYFHQRGFEVTRVKLHGQVGDSRSN